jgi:hypothetical protein
MYRWWEAHAARWEREQQALADAGIEFSVHEPAHKAGRLVLNLTAQWDGQPLRLVAHLPTAYPYFPPIVFAEGLNLARHQTPGTRQLCLLERDEWDGQVDTLAWMLTEQLQEVHRAQPGGPGEDAQGCEAEPLTAYLAKDDHSFVGFPAYDLHALPASGTFRIGVEQASPLRGTVLEVLDQGGHRLFTSEARSVANYASPGQVMTGRWVKLPTRPAFGDAKHFYDVAIEALPELASPLWQKPPSGAWRSDFVALLFEDELGFKKQGGNVIVVSKVQVLKPSSGNVGKPRINRVELESRENYFQRDALSAGLQDGCVALVGAGSVGSPVAKLLAQSGVGALRIIDHDVLDAGNAIRWELGRSGAGLNKAFLLQQFIEANWPYTKVEGFNWRVGDAHYATHADEPMLFEKLFSGVTCLVDATAAKTTSNYLADLARLHGLPFVWMHATNGAWGGLVGRAGPRKEDFCWICHRHYLDDGTIPRLLAAPEEEKVQPPGCLDATFVGSQVDLAEVSQMGARLIIDEVLTRVGVKEKSSYEWNVAVVELRDAEGRPQLPKWTPYVLPPHPKCPNH